MQNIGKIEIEFLEEEPVYKQIKKGTKVIIDSGLNPFLGALYQKKIIRQVKTILSEEIKTNKEANKIIANLLEQVKKLTETVKQNSIKLETQLKGIPPPTR